MMPAFRVVQEIVLFAPDEQEAAAAVQRALDAYDLGDNTNISVEASPVDPLV